MNTCPNTAVRHRSFTTFVVETRNRGAARSQLRCLDCGYEWEGGYASDAAAKADADRVRRLLE